MLKYIITVTYSSLMALNIQFLHYCLEQKGKKTKKGYYMYQACIQCIKMQESKIILSAYALLYPPY